VQVENRRQSSGNREQLSVHRKNLIT